MCVINVCSHALKSNRGEPEEVLFQSVVLCCYHVDGDADVREQVELQ